MLNRKLQKHAITGSLRVTKTNPKVRELHFVLKFDTVCVEKNYTGHNLLVQAYLTPYRPVNLRPALSFTCVNAKPFNL